MDEQVARHIGMVWLCLSLVTQGCYETPGLGDADLTTDADMPSDADAIGDADADNDTQEDADDADGDDPMAWELAALRPPEPPLGLPFPLVLRTSDGSPRGGTVLVELDGEVLTSLQLYRGRGSATLTIDQPGRHDLTCRADGEIRANTIVTLDERPVRELRGQLFGADLHWSHGEEIRLMETVVVPTSSVLVVEAGARILAGEGVNLEVEGELRVRGRSSAPVLFSRAGDQPWGGIRLLAGSSGELIQTLLTGGGGDPTLNFGHSRSQPVVFVERASLTVEGGGVIDNAGKGYSSSRAHVVIRDAVISRCDTGGEHRRSQVVFQGNHVLEIPDADGRLDDDDNDGIYLDNVLIEDGETLLSSLIDNVFFLGEDDGVDQNGSLLMIERCWIEGFHHEGIAASNFNGATVRDSVILGCGQGIEAGYGHPDVLVEHCLVAENGIGLRFGDDYDTPSEGHLSASHSVVVGSLEHNVFNFNDVLGGPFPEGIDISCSMVNAPEWDGQDGNVQGEATWDLWGCVTTSAPRGLLCLTEPLGPRTCR